MSIYDAARIQLVVIRWDKETKRGYIRDREGFEYLVTRANLAPECEGQLVKDDIVSGIADGMAVSDILIERGSDPIHERKEFESKGVEPAGSWDPHRPGVTPGIGHIRYGK